VAVSEGLKEGDVVVTSGADRLREGAKVELPGEAPPEPARANAAADGKGAGAARHRRPRDGQQGRTRGQRPKDTPSQQPQKQ
jgi:multidrug efflux system membrane fusion protein